MKFVILDWMDGSIEELKVKTEKKAKEKFQKIKLKALENKEEFDRSCFKVIEEFNNVK